MRGLSSAPAGRVHLYRTRRQDREHVGHKQQNAHIAEQMAAMLKVDQGLRSHDAGMHKDRPECEPDET